MLDYSTLFNVSLFAAIEHKYDDDYKYGKENEWCEHNGRIDIKGTMEGINSFWRP
jgi:hypothetical protein